MTGHQNQITQFLQPNRQTLKGATLARVHKEKIRPPEASLVTALRLLPWLLPTLGPGQHPGCGAVSESSDPSGCNHFTSVSTAQGSGPAAASAPEYTFTVALSDPASVVDKQGKDYGPLPGTLVQSGPSDCGR